MRGFHIGLQYPFNERFTGRIGYDYNNIVGHYDPNNIYWLYAIQSGSSSFKNVDSQQSIPYLGFDYKINKKFIIPFLRNSKKLFKMVKLK